MIGTGATPTVPGLVLDQQLGSGTFGDVWRGVDLGTGEAVAVRVGRPAGGAQAVAREGALLRRLEHENIVRLRSVVDLTDDVRALVLDLVPGGSVAALVARRGPLRPGEAATLVVGVARALQHLHAHGFVHGRLSPEGVLLDAEGRPVVTGLGIGTLLAQAGPGAGPVGGAPADPLPTYPSPAQDVLALGQMLRGVLPPGQAGPLDALVTVCTDGDPAARPTPDRIVQLVRQAVPPEPLDLSARAAGAVPAASTAPGWRPLPGRPAPVGPVPAADLGHPLGAPPPPQPRPVGVPVAAAPPVPAAPVAPAPGRRPASPVVPPAAAGGHGAGRLLVLVSVVVVGVLLAAGAVALALRPGGPQAPSPARPGPVAAPPSPTVLSDVAAVVARLAAARGAAFSAASEEGLAAADAPGSPALAQDVALVRRLRSAGVRLERLRFTVGDVHVLAATEADVTVEAQVATSAYRQVRPDGSVVRSIAAQPARRVQVSLVRIGDAWRVRAVL